MLRLREYIDHNRSISSPLHRRLKRTAPNLNLYKYFKLSNNRAANLILFWKKSTLHVLIPSCTFIYFEGFAILHVYSILHDYLFHKFQFTTYFTKFFEEFQIFAENEPNEYLDRVISISIQRLSFL